MQDQKVVEIEITEKVVDRLKGLGKIVGIPLALLAAVLSLWGIHSMSDVDVKIKKATDEAVANMNTKVNEATQKSIGDLNARVTKESDGIVQQARESARESLKTTVDSATKDLELRAKGAQSQFDHLKNRADDMQNQAEVLSKAMNRIGPQIASFDKRLGSVETTVEGLVKTVACDTENDRPVSSIEECHTNYPNGCSVAARYDAYLNSLKVQRLLGHNLLQASVLVLELTQSPCLVHFQAPVLRFPVVKGRVAHTYPSAELLHRNPGLRFLQHRHDLLFTKAGLLHRYFSFRALC